MRSPHLLDRADTTLTVLDFQERLVAAMPDGEAAVENCRKLIVAARRLDIPILVTEQYPKGLGRTMPVLREALGEAYQPIEKLAFSCCRQPAYIEALKQTRRRQMLLCGAEAHVCVLQTAIDLVESDYCAHVAADAVCSRKSDHRDIALAQLRAAGVVVNCAESAIFQWLECAGTDEFRDLRGLFAKT